MRGRSKVQVWCPHPPALMGGRVVGGQVERLKIGRRDVDPLTILPRGVTLDNIQWMSRKRPITPQASRSVRKVIGSKGKVYTVVTDERGKKSCTCPGYSFRRFCKHSGTAP